MIEAHLELFHAGVIYDSLVFDLNLKREFVLPLDIKPLNTNKVLVGRAFTCHGQDILPKCTPIRDYVRFDMLKHMKTNCIQVISGGRAEVAKFGDISGILSQKRKVKAVVIDGYTRDYDLLTIPVFCKGTSPKDAYGQWQIDSYDVPIWIGGVLINPWDYLHCSRDGIIVIPTELAPVVVGFAAARTERENAIRDELYNNPSPSVVGLCKKYGRW